MFIGGSFTPTSARVAIAHETRGQFEAVALLGLCQMSLGHLQRQGSNLLAVPNPTALTRRFFCRRMIRRRKGSLLLQARLFMRLLLIPLLFKALVLNVLLFVAIFATKGRFC